MKTLTNPIEQNAEFLRESVHYMPRGHGFCVKDLYHSDWKYFSETEKAFFQEKFAKEFVCDELATVISLGINDQGHEVFAKPFFDLVEHGAFEYEAIEEPQL